MIKQQCADKGFDAVETDLDETYNGNEGTTGFTITESDEQTYLTTLANYMHSIGLGWIAKDLDDTGDGFAGVMEPLASGIITEQCNQYGTCGQLTSYEGHKAVLNAEYSPETTAEFCTSTTPTASTGPCSTTTWTARALPVPDRHEQVATAAGGYLCTAGRRPLTSACGR